MNSEYGQAHAFKESIIKNPKVVYFKYTRYIFLKIRFHPSASNSLHLFLCIIARLSVQISVWFSFLNPFCNGLDTSGLICLNISYLKIFALTSAKGRAYDGKRTPLLMNEVGFCIFDLRNYMSQSLGTCLQPEYWQGVCKWLSLSCRQFLSKD